MPGMIDLEALPTGAKLKSPLFDNRSTKLLSEGLMITSDVLTALRKRGVCQVIVDDCDMARINAFRPQGILRDVPPDRKVADVAPPSEQIKHMEEKFSKNLRVDIATSDKPFSAHIKRPGAVAFDRELTGHLADQNESRVDGVGQTLKTCTKGDSSVVVRLKEQAASTVSDAKEDLDAFLCLGINPSSHGYPSRHSVHASMLSMAIGTTLGLEETELKDMAVGCLVHDLGMLAINQDVVNAKRNLDDIEFCEVVKHPYKTFDILNEGADLIPASSRMVAYQIHERCNGTGYPRRRQLNSIHYLARIAAVADAYTALVTPRPHRKGMLPYAAVELMVRGVASGLYDGKVVRGLLETIGLFPIGSFVEIGEEFVGRVIRSNGINFERPVIEMWKRGKLSAPPAIIDLSQELTLRITRSLPRLFLPGAGRL